MKKLMKGNEAIVHGALLGGATHYFGYPITPASEIAHAAAEYFPRCGRHFLQAECEIASVNMLFGAAAAGARVMTGSSGPGIALMAEGFSYIAGAELPAVVVDVQRSGPGLGNIWPEQGDYHMAVKGGGHGNYKALVLAPNSAQEMCDFSWMSFELAEKYRTLVILLADACIGQMMEPVSLPGDLLENPRKDWALYGDADSRNNLVTSLSMNTETLGAHNRALQEKYAAMDAEIDYEEVGVEDADTLFVAYGISSRICRSAVEMLRASGQKVGLFRPKTLFPFPKARLRELGEGRKLVVVELSNGQMVEDVRLSVSPGTEVALMNWMGGQVPTVSDILDRMEGGI